MQKINKAASFVLQEIWDICIYDSHIWFHFVKCLKAYVRNVKRSSLVDRIMNNLLKLFTVVYLYFLIFLSPPSYFRISKGTDWHSLLLCWTGITIKPNTLLHQVGCMPLGYYRRSSEWCYDISQDHCRETTVPFKVSFNHFHCWRRKLISWYMNFVFNSLEELSGEGNLHSRTLA